MATLPGPSLELGLPPHELRDQIQRALKEDLGNGDLTSSLTLGEGAEARGTFQAQEELVVAGLPVAAEVFRTLDASIHWQAEATEGAAVGPGARLAGVVGPARALLAGERVALNFLQHLSGIATQTCRFKAALDGLRTELLDTRKTTPGLRALEKYAVRVGGGRNHRLGLYDGILIKNNHVRLAGGVGPAVERARRGRPVAPLMPVEVEVSNLAELEEAIAAGADIVLLDNMTPAQVRVCVERAGGRVRLEVSGGINAANIRDYAETGVDRISVGALTHSAPAVAIHFRMEPYESRVQPVHGRADASLAP
jgi:nicotinate-nucleotide pyrophosphorylase (carboxylating)